MRLRRSQTRQQPPTLSTATVQVHARPDIALITNHLVPPSPLWLRAKERQAGKAAKRVKAGLTAAAAGRTGAGPKYLFSSLLRCSYCGSSYVIARPNLYPLSRNVHPAPAVCAHAPTLPPPP